MSDERRGGVNLASIGDISNGNNNGDTDGIPGAETFGVRYDDDGDSIADRYGASVDGADGLAAAGAIDGTNDGESYASVERRAGGLV